MDDNIQKTAQPVSSNPIPTATDSVSNMSDVVGMTPPPPAPVMPDLTDLGLSMPTATPAPSDPAPMAMPTVPNMPAMPAMPGAESKTPEGQDDYSYAEDVLNEILDSLDRIEAKVEAIEKKMG